MNKKFSWDEYLKFSRPFNDHYAMPPGQQKLAFEYAQKVPKDGLLLEIGIAHGQTASILIKLSGELGFKYACIDNFSLDSTFEVVKENLDKIGVEYELIVGDSKELTWDRPLDMLIVDGGHAEPEVKNDCEKFIKHIKPGGYLFLHDYLPDELNTPNNAHWAINHYGDMHTIGWIDLGLHEDMLKIKQRPLL